jgi:uncharacterized protein
MDALKEHTIAFSGLKDGAHVYQFQLSEAFFTAAGEEEMEGGDVLVDVGLDKSPTLLVVDLHAKGTVDLRCDHCDAPLAFALEGSQKQIFRLTGEEEYDDDELVSLDDRSPQCEPHPLHLRVPTSGPSHPSRSRPW